MAPTFPVRRFVLLSATSALVAACSSASPDSEPTGTTEQRWEAESVHQEGQSTHLWLVDHAVAILRQHREIPAAAAALKRMEDPVCAPQWQQGLFDADFKALYNDGFADLQPYPSTLSIILSGTTWKSHFFDPDSGQNYEGELNPTARTRAADFSTEAKTAFSAGDVARGCYHLGLALHYVTDVSQPMHASNFTATDQPLKLHSNVETYALGVQDRYVLRDWSGAPRGTADDVLLSVAHRAKTLWPAMKQTLVAQYGARCGFAWTPLFDWPQCWSNVPAVNDRIGDGLKLGQDAAAQYLVALKLN